MIDHYRVLGVPPTADLASIRAAYVALMKQLHPDRDSSPETLRRAQAVTAAYRVLSDPARRAAHDDDRADHLRWEQPGLNHAEPRRRRRWVPALAGVAGAAAIAALIAYPPSLPRSARTSAPTPTPALPGCASFADDAALNAAVRARLARDELQALPDAARALRQAAVSLSDVRSAESVEEGRVACSATVTIALPADYSTAGGERAIVSDLLFSATRDRSSLRLAPDPALAAALRQIAPVQRLAALEPALVVEPEPSIEPELAPVPPPLPERRPDPVRKSPIVAPPKPGTPVPAPLSGLSSADVARLAGQTQYFYAQSHRNASAGKRAQLEGSHVAFVARVARCRADRCRADAYLARNMEISRIMLGE